MRRSEQGVIQRSADAHFYSGRAALTCWTEREGLAGGWAIFGFAERCLRALCAPQGTSTILGCDSVSRQEQAVLRTGPSAFLTRHGITVGG